MLSVIAVLVAAVFFGTTGTSQALGPDSATPATIGVMRMLIGGSALAVLSFTLVRWRAGRHPHKKQPQFSVSTAALMTLTGVCLVAYQPLFFLGTARNGVAIGTVVALGSTPILAGIGQWLFTRRTPSRTWMLATAMATVGVILLGFGGNAENSAGTDAVGLLSSVGAGASFAVIVLAQRQLLDRGWNAFTVVGAMGLTSALLSAIALPFIDLSWLAEPGGLTMALWLGLVTIAAAYSLFTWGLGGLAAAPAATLSLGEPLTASLLGIIVLGERLSPLAVIGLIVLAVGLLTLAWGSRPPRDPKPFAVEA